MAENKKKIKVLVVPSDTHGVGLYRSRRPHEKLQELYAKERNYDDNFRFQAKEKFKERSSSTCSCSECETRYKKEIALKFNLICPVCQNWMIPDGAKETYQKAKNRIKAQQATLEALIKDQIKKDAQNTSNIRYFYLLDFHH